MHLRTALVILMGLVALGLAVTYRMMVVTVTFDVYVVTGGLGLAGVLILIAAWALEMQLRTESRFSDRLQRLR